MGKVLIVIGLLILVISLAVAFWPGSPAQMPAQTAAPRDTPIRSVVVTQPAQTRAPAAAITETPTLTPTAPLIYLGTQAPGREPQVFLPGVVSTTGIEFYIAIHPNQREVYFTRIENGTPAIYASYYEGGAWSEPALAPFSSDFKDTGPFITPDGGQIFFWSTRPLVPGTLFRQEFQLWMAPREGNGWGKPVDLALPLESASGEESVSVTADGTLYYMADYPDLGGFGLYRAELAAGEYQMPEKVDVMGNEEGLVELEPIISPDERFLLFYSVGRPDNLTPDGRVGDLYIAFQQADGRWSEPQNLGEPVNSRAEESTPALSADGRYLFFASNRAGSHNFPDIYWVSADILPGFEP